MRLHSTPAFTARSPLELLLVLQRGSPHILSTVRVFPRLKDQQMEPLPVIVGAGIESLPRKLKCGKAI